MASAKKKGAKARMEKEKRPMVLLTEDLHRQLKVYAATHGSTVKQIVAEAVSQFLERHKRKA